jgi:hypothetical protein
MLNGCDSCGIPGRLGAVMKLVRQLCSKLIIGHVRAGSLCYRQNSLQPFESTTPRDTPIRILTNAAPPPTATPFGVSPPASRPC